MTDDDQIAKELKQKATDNLDVLFQLKTTIEAQSDHLESVIEQKNLLKNENERMKAEYQHQIEAINKERDQELEIEWMKGLIDSVNLRVESFAKKGDQPIANALKQIIQQINRVIGLIQQK